MANISIAKMKKMVDDTELAHETLERYGIQYRPSRGSDHRFCCPWHAGSGSSAHTDDSEDFTWCFLCEKDAPHGDRYNVVAGMYNLSRPEAIAKVAFDAGLISKEELDSKLNGKITAEELEELRTASASEMKKRPAKAPETDEFRAFGSILYTEMRDYFGLSAAHRKMLKEVRHLSDDRIEKDYFTFPYAKREYELFVLQMELKYPKRKDQIRNYAGFWFEKYSGRTYLLPQSGLGILIRNARQEVTAVQIRKDNPGDGSRYVWLSSAFALACPDLNEGGASPSHQIDVMLPQKNDPAKLGWLTITEGRFKSEILAQHGHTVISIQGVGNYKGVIEEIKSLQMQTGITYKHIFICYDADMFINTKVLKHTVGLAEELKKLGNITISVVTWKREYGKGIDDMIFAGHKNDIHMVSPEKIIETFQVVVKSLLEEYNLPKIPPKCEELQERMQLALGV